MYSNTQALIDSTPQAQEVRGMAWLAEPDFVILRQAARRISEGKREAAESLLDRLPLQASIEDGPARRLLAVFTRALREAYGDAGNAHLGNLYMDEIDAGSMIRAYEVMVAHTPFIRFAYAAANHTLLEQCRHHDDMHVVDIGIGAGSQWLDLVSRAEGVDTQLQLTGIDVPDDSDGGADALIAAGERVTRAASTANLSVHYQAIPARIESLALEPLRSKGAPLFLNALLALHHTPSSDAVSNPMHSRNALLRRLRNLQPTCMVIVEPDSEHDNLGFVDRVDEALRHYSTVFGALDALLPRTLAERQTIENRFFGREVLNIVAGERGARVERHQRRQAWARSFTDAGFVALPLPVNANVLSQELNLPAEFTITDDDGMQVLRFQGSPLLAASAWGCASSEMHHAG